MTGRTPEIILASASVTRRRMLGEAGVAHRSVAARVDETAAKARFAVDHPGATPENLARHLAQIKAEAVSRDHPQALVIGADQVLEAGGHFLSKPAGRDEARAQLQGLRGRSHTLVSAVALATGGACGWQDARTARLTMRDFSDAFLEAYLDRAGPAILGSVGAYQIEGAGAGLMARVEGDHWTILGMPLLPLLERLRTMGAIAS